MRMEGISPPHCIAIEGRKTLAE